MDNVYGKWNANKPQLFKDIPLIDPISFQLEYLTGNTDMGDVQGGIAPIGGWGKFNKLRKNRLKKD